MATGFHFHFIAFGKRGKRCNGGPIPDNIVHLVGDRIIPERYFGFFLFARAEQKDQGKNLKDDLGFHVWLIWLRDHVRYRMYSRRVLIGYHFMPQEQTSVY